jgi:3-isopropylmalate/(R)-2-methylmalate dehydratase small subunit
VKDAQGFSASFSIDPFRRDCLLKGLDDIGLSLRHADALDRFEKKHDAAFWVTPKAQERARA